MTMVVLRGWKQGIQTISLMRLIMAKCGVGLIAAKTHVDELVGGEPQSFSFADVELAQEFEREALRLGALV